MPLAIYNASMREELNEILNSRIPANSMELEYVIGTEDVTDYVIQAEWGRPSSDRPALEFTAQVKLELPPEMRNDVVRINLHVGGLVFRRFTGRVLRLRGGRGRTEVQAVSAGYWLDKIRLDENRSYSLMEPGEVVRQVIDKNGRYNLRYSDVSAIQGPKFDRSGALRFRKIDKLADVLGAVAEEADLFYRDSPLNAPILSRDVGPAEAKHFVHQYTVGEEIDSAEWLPESTGDEYYDVVVYRDIDGDVEYLFEPIHIPGSTAPVGAGYEIEVSDATTGSDDDAWTTAMMAAQRLTYGEANQSITVDWIHPLVTDGDFLTITEPLDLRVSSRAAARYWIAKVLSQKETSDKTHTMELLMVRSHEREATPRVSRIGNSRTKRLGIEAEAGPFMETRAPSGSPTYAGAQQYPSTFTYPGG